MKKYVFYHFPKISTRLLHQFRYFFIESNSLMYKTIIDWVMLYLQRGSSHVLILPS